MLQGERCVWAWPVRSDRIDLAQTEVLILPHPPLSEGWLFLIVGALLIFVVLPRAAMAINGIAISSSDPGAVPGASTKVRRKRRILAGAK